MLKEDFIVGKDLTKVYSTKGNDCLALDHVNFIIPKKSFTVITGPSGAGKTTLLNILGGMDTCTSGALSVFGLDLSSPSKKVLTDFRRFDVGFVFQFYNLMPNLTLRENVELAVEICKRYHNPDEVLNTLGLAEQKNKFPSQVSGGQQQRASIARAIAKNPKILLCDEPTGALDSQTGKEVLKLLRWLVDEKGKTVIVVTHNAQIKEIGDFNISIKNGKIDLMEPNKKIKNVDDLEW